MRTVKNVTLLGVIVSVGLVASASARQARPVQQVQTPLCTLPDKTTYSPGALIRQDGQVYRCYYAYGEELKPIGVAWIKMQETFAPKEPAEGR
jgi:hypothetical protein